ncbi:hypothetical protein B0H21DRAFT_732743 [Amylocystis lapponica]|nr:hypothetical protein B0H21DRAFT_732743 [Amylocystis lapponica]
MRSGARRSRFAPMLLGSVVQNSAVQPFLDGVCAYLLMPSETVSMAHDIALPIDTSLVPFVPAGRGLCPASGTRVQARRGLVWTAPAETCGLFCTLNRFRKEDPAFRVHVDRESKVTIKFSMGSCTWRTASSG